MSSPTKTETVLLLGRPGFDANKDAWSVPGVTFLTAATTDEANAASDQGPIDHVVIGSLPQETKVAVVEAILKRSKTTTIHINSEASGAEGFKSFVARLLRGLDGVSA